MREFDKIKILHYLYLNEIDIHFLSMIEDENEEEIIYQSLYSNILKNYCYNSREEVVNYLRVISLDFDYLQNEHDDEGYEKPSFWKAIEDCSDQQSKRVNEWKNRYEERSS